MSRIEFNIVALGDFSSINAQLKSFQAQVQLLQKNLSGVGLNSSLQKDLGSLNASFKQTLLSTGQFTESTVKMSSETARFGEALVTGKLKLSEYYGIITQKSTQAVAQVKALALEQTKLQNSMVVSDPSRQGILSVYTPSKIDKVANATKIVANEQNLYNIAVAKGSQELINWGKNTQWAGRQLTVGMSVPLMIFGQEAVSAFKDVNIELTRLQRLYGEGLTPPSQAEIDKISGQVINLGKEIAGTMGIAQTETVKAAANFAAMGRQGKDLLDITAQTMRLSKLGAVSTADATNTVVALQNVYKVNTYDLADAVNFLSDIQKQTTMTLGDMTQAIPRVGPIMQQLGGTYKDTAVMLVAMREAGIPAAQAANAIKSAVASMIAPTKSASAEFQKYGISLTGIKTSTQGNPVKMIEALQAGMSKLSPLVKEQLIEKLFGKFQFARVSALLENFGKTGSQTVNAIKIAGATSGELATLANQEMKQATESPTAKFQRSLESFKANLLPIGQKIVEFTTKLMDFANAISKIFSGLPGPIKTVMGAVAVGVALSGPVIMLTGLIANFVGYLVKGMFNLKQLATGGKTLGQLLTPELIAAQNASKIFSSGLADDVTAIDLLSTAIQDLTLNLKEMAAALSMSTNVSGLSQKISGITKTEEMLFSQPHLPGFASGGFVPGNGNSDTFPAMLTPGEAVIPKDKAAKHAKFINAMINGTLPGYARGLGIGSDRISENSDPNSLAGTGGFGGRVGRSLLKKTSWSSMELEKQAAKEALSNTGYSEEEISHELRTVGAHTVAPTQAYSSMFNIPYKRKSSSLQDVMPEFEGSNNFASQLSKETDPTFKAFKEAVQKGTIDAKEFGMTQEELVLELDKMKANVVADTSQHAKIIKSMTDYGLATGTVTENLKKQAITTSSTLGARLTTDYYDKPRPTLGNLVVGSEEYVKKQEQINRSSDLGYRQFGATLDAKHILKNPEVATPEIRNTFKESTAGLINLTKGGSLGNIIETGVVTNEASSVVKKTKNETEKIVKAGNEGLGNNSPSIKGEESGRNYIKGIEIGIQEESPKLAESADLSVQQILDVIAKINNPLKEEIAKVTTTASEDTQPWKAVGENYGNAVQEGLFDITESMLPKIDEVNVQVIDKFKSNGSELHSLLLTNAGEIVNDQIKIYSEGGTKISTAFKDGMELPIRSIGSDIHEEMIANMLEVSGMTKESYAAGMAQGEAFKSGYKQGELGFNDPVQQMIPGFEGFGKDPLVRPSSESFSKNPYGPRLENGEFTSNKGMLGNTLNKAKGVITKPNGKMNMMGKMGFSSALMMGGPMISGALPQGSLAQSAASNVSTFAGMGMMFGPQAAAAGAALGLLVTVFQNSATKIREQSNNLKGSITISSVAAQTFGINFKPLAVYDFAKTSDGLDKHAKSISDNMGAVDTLTQAYLNASDQLTKDQIHVISGLSKEDLLKQINKTYNADITGGLTQDQAKQDVISQMRAAGKSAYDINYVKKNLTNPSNTGEAFNNVVKFAANNLSKSGQAQQRTDPKTNYRKEELRINTLRLQDAQIRLQNKSGGYMSEAEKNAIKKEIAAYKKNVEDITAALDPGATKTSIISDETIQGLSASLVQLTTGPVTNLKDSLESLTKKGNEHQKGIVNNVKVYDALSAAMEKSSPGFDKASANFKNLGGDTIGLAEAITMMNSQLIDSDKVMAALSSKDPEAISKLWKANVKALLKEQKIITPTTTTTTTTDPSYVPPVEFKGTKEELDVKAKLEAKVKVENTILKTLRHQLEIEKRKSTEAKRQMDYKLQMEGLNQQSKEALISGNYLQAAMLNQQAKGATVDFNATTKENIMQGKMDIIQQRTDVFSQALSNLNDAISQGVKTIDATVAYVTKLPSVSQKDIKTNSAGIAVHVNVNSLGADYDTIAETVAKAAHKATIDSLHKQRAKSGNGANRVSTAHKTAPKLNSGK